MEYLQAKQQLNSNFYPVLSINGDDAYLVLNAVKLVEDSLNISFAEVNRLVLEQPNIKQIMDNTLNMPFGSDKRIVIVRDFIINKTNSDSVKKQLTAYALNPNYSVCLVFVNTDDLSKIEGITNINCSKLSPGILIDWVSKSLKGFGKIISNQTARQLVEYCNYEMTRISSEVNKLSFCNADEITSDIVSGQVYMDITSTTYKLLDYISKSDLKLCFYTLDKLLASGEEKTLIFGAIYSAYRRMFFVRTNKLSIEEIADKLNVKPNAVEIGLKLSNGYSVKQLLKALEVCQIIDRSMKLDYNKDNQVLRNLILQLINIKNVYN